MRIAIAVPDPHRERLSREAHRHGHEVVLTSTGAEDLVAACEAARPELLIVLSTVTALTSELLSHCDSRGIRLLAVIAHDSHRRHAADVGVFERVVLEAPWTDFEVGLLSRLREPGDKISPSPATSPVAALIAPPPAPPAVLPRALATPSTAAPRPSRRCPPPASRVSDFPPETVLRAGGEVHSSGQVIAVWGAAGAPGRTMLAISVAAELAARGYRVALCDADPYSASIAPTLGILDEAPGFAAACRLAGNNALNLGELERIGSRYGSPTTGFWVLTGISSPNRWPELSAQRVEATLAQCRTWADFTVVDTGFSLEGDEEISSDLHAPRRNAATISALGVADRVLAVGAADPVGLSRFLRGYSDLVEFVEAQLMTVVINKLRASAIGLNPTGQVQQTLERFAGITDAVLVPYDHAAMDTALLSGRTLREVAPKSAMQLAITQLVATRLLQ